MKIKFIIIITLLTLTSLTFAQDEIDLTNVETEQIELLDEHESIPLKVKHVKEMLTQIGNENTCLDEYLTRRKRLILNLSFAPVDLALITLSSTYGAGLATSLVLHLVPGSGSWADLGYLLGGLMIGAATGVVVSGVDLHKKIKELKGLDLIIKSLGESYSGADEFYLNKMYQNFKTNYPHSNMSLELMKEKLLTLDHDSQLCNGSMSTPPKIRLWKKLKHKLAKPIDIYQKLAE